jgi:hypothetical protein
MKQPEISRGAMRDGSRDASSSAPHGASGCLVCGRPLTDSRARFCSPAHRQLAYRLRRHEPSASTEADLHARFLQQRRLTAHTVYECPSCGDRFVGERRCVSCGLFCRSLGVGGHCPECDHPILLSDLLE